MIDETLCLDKIASNLHRVSVGDLKIYYSYKTPIAFENKDGLRIRENDWKQTTGKHLNKIDNDHKKRIDGIEFIARLQETLEGYGLHKGLATIE